MKTRRPITHEERRSLLERRTLSIEAFDRLTSEGDREQADRCLAQARTLEQEYFERLPERVLSRCPFDNTPLLHTFDSFGLDGLWWTPTGVTPDEPPTCDHFCVLLGAVALNGRPVVGSRAVISPGPGVPYVIPRLLGIPTMVAVVSRIQMDCGYAAFPIAYFAERRPPTSHLTAGWCRTLHYFRTDDGELVWDVPNDAWDFDLRRWWSLGRLRWCTSGASGLELNTPGSTNCPFIDLPGTRAKQQIQGDRCWTAGVPDGSPIFPTPMD